MRVSVIYTWYTNEMFQPNLTVVSITFLVHVCRNCKTGDDHCNRGARVYFGDGICVKLDLEKDRKKCFNKNILKEDDYDIVLFEVNYHCTLLSKKTRL